jgi:outer membrane protein OmpA-like peptidoglycan-associated protein
MLRTLTLLAALLLFLGSGTAALANDAGSRLGLGLRAVVKGKEKPAIILRPRAALKKVSIELSREGFKTTLKSGKIRAGGTKEIRFKQPVGVFDYQARFQVQWSDGERSDFTTTFKITKVGELELKMGAGDVDMEARRMTFRITNPAKTAQLLILGAQGVLLDTVEQSFDGQAPGSELALEWDEVDGDIVRMDLKVTDVANFHVGMQVTPFSIDIPHDDVEFASGKHAIKPAEEPKLRSTLGHIHKALASHGTLLTLRLYIGGCTDTVGPKGSNQSLSERRARSIAAWFRKNGVDIPTFYKGYGEERLAVPTPDDTDEPRNRRAEYVLSSLSPPGGGWKKL